MGKFCGKCGSKLDEKTGLCPNCDADKLNSQQKPAEDSAENGSQEQKQQEPSSMPPDTYHDDENKKSDKKTKKKVKPVQKENSHKTGGPLRRILVVLVLLLVLAIGTTGLLAYCGMVNIPIFTNLFDQMGAGNTSADIEKDIPETDTSGFVFYDSSKENVVTDAGMTFVNNEILVTLRDEQFRADLEKYLSSVGGEIVGEIPELREYQILLDQSMSYNALTDLVHDLESLDWVRSATPNYVIDLNADYIPNDKKWKNQWSDIPEGQNWGVEAIDVPDAWEYKDQLGTVNIGIFDNVFDVFHEDLNFSEQPLGNTLAVNAITNWKEKYSHGTHTAGTAAAIFDNKKGIAGISVKTNLYGASSNGIGETVKGSLQNIRIALYYLIGMKDCSVVNMSLGADVLTFNASRECCAAEKQLDEFASGIADCLRLLIDSGHQFVICKSAGNQNADGGYRYFLKDTADSVNAYDYLSYSEYCDYLKGEGTAYHEKAFSRYKDRKAEIEERLISGNVDAKYDILGAITDEKVRNRILIVGAVENLGSHKEGGFLFFGGTEVHDGYAIADYSQCGEAVDILAPGGNYNEKGEAVAGIAIHSTFKNGYGYMCGTSMAAPHVAGVAGLVFAANPDLKGDDVKRILCDSAVGSYGEEKYGLLNANNAVQAALHYTPQNMEAGQFELSGVPDEAVEFNGHYYYAYPASAAANWELAQQYCEEKNGYLATITSQEENDFLYSYIHQKGFDQAYFGLSGGQQEDGWKWANGEELEYTNWESDNSKSGNYALLYSERAKDMVKSAQSSSELTEETTTYSVDQIMDGDFSTAWADGVDGQGIGESISLIFDQTYLLSGFEINAGFQKNNDLYWKNSRPETITIEYPDGSSEQCILQDINDKQTAYLQNPVETDRLTIRIDSVYEGTKYQDTAISELTPIAYKQDGGTWETGNFTGAAESDTTAFLCEWGEYQLNADNAGRTTSEERDIVLVLDISGSMAGTPLEETKKAASSFIDTVLEEDASIGIVTYAADAEMVSDFSVENSHLQGIVEEISSGGGTNIEAGLAKAQSMLNSSNAKQKIIVLMSDGEPNEGKVDEELIAYADQIKQSDITIYTLGFFESLGDKSAAQALMEQIASDGCHYEVENADNLVFFFGDIADQINGQKYIYIRIACPVDVSVSYQGETLDSSEENLQTRTAFGSLTFEESEEEQEEQADTQQGSDNRIKTLRLKDGVQYDIRIQGTGLGKMNYTIGFMDENGDYSDLRNFEDIRINRSTIIDTVAANTDTTELKVDEDGDGKYDLKYRAKANETGEIVDYTLVIYGVLAAVAVILVGIGVFVLKRRAKKRMNRQ